MDINNEYQLFRSSDEVIAWLKQIPIGKERHNKIKEYMDMLLSDIKKDDIEIRKIQDTERLFNTYAISYDKVRLLNVVSDIEKHKQCFINTKNIFQKSIKDFQDSCAHLDICDRWWDPYKDHEICGICGHEEIF